MQTKAQKEHQQILAKIEQFRKAGKNINFFQALFVWLIYQGLYLTVILLVNAAFELSSAVRLFFLVSTFLVSVALLILFLGPPFFDLLFRRRHPSDNDIALRLGLHWQKIQDRLANALQLIDGRERHATQYSTELIDEAIQEISRPLHNKKFTDLLDRKRMRKRAGYLTLIYIAIAIFVLIAPDFWRTGLARTFYPNTMLSPEESLAFDVKPGNITLPKGDPLQVRASIRGISAEKLFLHVVNEQRVEKIEMIKTTGDTFYYEIASVKDSLKYFVSCRRGKSASFSVSIIEFPILRSLQIILTPPAYTALGPVILDKNIGDITALKGTRVAWDATANKRLRKGELVFTGGRKVPFRVMDHRISTSFTILEEDVYTYQLMDILGLESSNPITYHIQMLTDHYPFIRILAPGKDIDLGEDMVLPLIVQAQDDYGITRIHLAYQVLTNAEAAVDSSRFHYLPLPIPPENKEQMQIAFRWDLSASPLLPNEVVVYYVAVYDNDTVNGPKKTKSPLYRARFPSIYDLYQEINRTQDDAIAQYEHVYEKSTELHRKMESLSLQLKRLKELSWQKRQEIEESIEQQEELRRKIENTAQQLDEMINKSEQNKLLSPETIQKYRELQELYHDIMTPELQAALEKIREAMQNLDENLLQKAVDDLKMSEAAFNSSLERTISLLKRLKIQQQIEQAMRLSEDIAERQKNLSDQFLKKQGDIEKITREQAVLEKNAQELNDLIQELNNKVRSDDTIPSEEISRAAEMMKNASLPSQMQQSAQEMQSGHCNAVQQLSENIQSDLNKVAEQLRLASEAMSGAAQRRAMQALRNGMDNLLALSKMQESLMEQTKTVSTASAKMQSLAESQQNLSSGLQRVTNDLYEASKETFAIQSSVGASLGKATKHMQKSLQAFENRNSGATVGEQGHAMAELNEAALQIFSSLQSMMRGGKAGGMSMDQFMQQMQNLASSQQGINAATSSLGEGSQMSLAQQAAMSRLAEQQGAVRKTMEELIKEVSEMSNFLGDMDKIAEDMKEVEKDLLQGDIRRETIDRQNRILSRMLDAQKSVREREFSKRRKAESGKEYAVSSPSELPDDFGERINRLQQDLLRAKKEGYTRDYLELIKQYFEAIINREEIQTNH